MTNLTPKQLDSQLGTFQQVNRELGEDLSLDTLLERIVRLARAQVKARYATLELQDDKGLVGYFVRVCLLNGEVKRVFERECGENQSGSNATLKIPILSGERVLGKLLLSDKQDAAEFTPDDERLMKTLMAYASIAITNVRLYQNILGCDRQLTQQNEDLSLINDLAQTVANSWDIKEIMSQTLSHVLNYLKMTTGEIYLRDKGGDDLRLSLLRGEHFEAFYSKNIFRVGEGIVGKVAEQGKPLVCYSLATDPRILRPAVPKAGFRCLAGIPLLARRKTVGVMTLSCKDEHQFTDREFDLLTTIGTWAGTAIENVQLQQQSNRVAVLEERERIGMDLHDGIIQSLYSIGLTLDYVKVILKEENDTENALKRLMLTTNGINNAINDIRSYVSGLRPSQMQADKTLPENIAFIIEQFETYSQIKGELICSSKTFPNLPYENTVTLFHICQEALANAARHSHATKARVNLWAENGAVHLEISDNGKGFNVDSTKKNLGHGLSNMQRRTRKVGGSIKIDSAPLRGTCVQVWVPNGEVECGEERVAS
ncbi:MAG: hypothetical protein DRI56_11290 [Chloroflexota bacterium]|nr:MAG: hypothetical protein DRI56_11290 [Chloroflexota bacterium]